MTFVHLKEYGTTTADSKFRGKNASFSGILSYPLFVESSNKSDNNNVYKCCKSPVGYYIDYTSCVYKPTHDQYWEFYDSTVYIVMCDSGYVMTGMAKKVHPVVEEYYLEWIQCCRLGFSPVPVFFKRPPHQSDSQMHPRKGRSVVQQYDEESYATDQRIDSTGNCSYVKTYAPKIAHTKDYSHLYAEGYVKVNVVSRKVGPVSWWWWAKWERRPLVLRRLDIVMYSGKNPRENAGGSSRVEYTSRRSVSPHQHLRAINEATPTYFSSLLTCPIIAYL